MAENYTLGYTRHCAGFRFAPHFGIARRIFHPIPGAWDHSARLRMRSGQHHAWHRRLMCGTARGGGRHEPGSGRAGDARRQPSAGSATPALGRPACMHCRSPTLPSMPCSVTRCSSISPSRVRRCGSFFGGSPGRRGRSLHAGLGRFLVFTAVGQVDAGDSHAQHHPKS